MRILILLIILLYCPLAFAGQAITGNLTVATGNVGVGTTFVSSSALTIMNGNVGIGTWVPATALDINGATTLRGNLLFGTDATYSIGVNPGNMPGSIYARNNVASPAFRSLQTGAGILIQNGVGFSAANQTSVAMLSGSTYTNSSGVMTGVSVLPTYNQTSTAGATDFLINRTETVVGSGAQLLFDAQVGGTSKFVINNQGNVGIGTTIVSNGSLLVMSGNVGIGTWKPEYNLQVNGTIVSFIPGTSPTGGTITTNGANTVHTFTSNGSFVLPNNGTVTYVVQGGGGGGGGGCETTAGAGGGGGAGGYLAGSTFLAAGTYTITVGTNGTGGAACTAGTSGADSVAFSLTATGGGYGGAPTNGTGANGGSGGGGAGVGGPQGGGTGVVGQGNNGGNGSTTSGGNKPGGGGGGSSAVGAAAGGTSTGGAGGAGTANSISGSSVTYGCGGGAGTYNGGTPGSGGCSSAGNGGTQGTAATAATANLGGGGGGGGNNAGTPTVGAAGGSGVVIASYVTSSQGGNKYIRTTTGAALGVNTNVPVSQLDVVGSVGVGSSYGGVVAAPQDGMIVQGNTGIGTSSPSTLFEVGTRKFNILSGGNVGIGTINPGQALDVQGTVRVSKLGSTLAIASGSNGCIGQSTLSSGVVTVTTSCTPATSAGIFLTDAQSSLLNVGSVTIATVSAGSSFVIQSTNVADGSNVNWFITKSN